MEDLFPEFNCFSASCGYTASGLLQVFGAGELCEVRH